MKTLLSVLGSLAITGSGAAVLSNSTNALVQTNHQKTYLEESINSNNLSYSSETLEKYQQNNQNITTSNLSYSSQAVGDYLENNQDSTLKEDLLNSLFFNNEKIGINVSLLTQYQNNSTLYSVLTGEELQTKLSEMYNNGFLVYDQDTQKFSFIEYGVANYSWKIWTESHWYWFGYWKLKFNHEAARDLAAMIKIGTTVAQLCGKILAWSGPLKVAMDIVARLLLINSYLLTTYDEGNGVWIGFMLVVPDMGWGSL